MCPQFDILLIGSIVSYPKTNWPGFFCLVRWYVLRTMKAAAAKMPIHGSESSKYVSVDYRNVQDSLILDVFFLWLLLPMDYMRKHVLSEYHIIVLPRYFKLVTK